MPRGKRDVKELWALLGEGEPEGDETILITSSMINQQTAERMAALSEPQEKSNNTQHEKENMSTPVTASLKEFDSLKELKEAAFNLGELHFKFENELTVPFMEYYGKYYRIVKGIPQPKEGMSTLFDLVTVNDDHALFLVRGYTETIREINPNPTPPEDPDRDADDYFLESEVHTRERFVYFPLDFLEKKDEYLQEAAKVKADKAAEEAEQEKKAAKAELKELKRRQKELEAAIKDAAQKLQDKTK